jgi:dienelactone hydrolase
MGSLSCFQISEVVKNLRENGWGASVEELATDTLSAIEYVKNQELFEYSAIGVIGFSQGGWIAPVAAANSDDVSFVVSMSGSAVTADETLVYQETNNIAAYTYTFIAKLFAPISASNLKQNERLSALYPFDPVPYWKKVHVPVFFAYGDNDPWVPVNASINRLKENNLAHFNVKTYPGGMHGIIDTKTHEMSGEYLHDLVRFIKAGS